jgi:hypothetical protein
MAGIIFLLVRGVCHVNDVKLHPFLLYLVSVIPRFYVYSNLGVYFVNPLYPLLVHS